MRPLEEIEYRLEQAIQEYEAVKEWHDETLDRYEKDKKDWGQADYGEVDYSGEELSKITREVSVLKWVLNAT